MDSIMRLQLRRTQNNFTVKLYPVNITQALDRFQLQSFLPLDFKDLATEGMCMYIDIVKQSYG